MQNFWNILPKPFLVLAPMEDVTDFAFREVIAEISKPDVLFTEFTNTEGLFSKGFDRVVQNFKFSQKQKPIVAQIWGIQPENFYKAGQLVRELGFDGLDINMGCPYKKVLKCGSGAALINNPTLAQELIAAAKEGAQDLPVSVKTRIGVDKVITEEWIGFLLNQTLSALTVHGRIAKDMSKKPADWAEIGKAVKLRNTLAPETVIIGNGDVTSYPEALEKHKIAGVDGIMIGRGIFSNPWLFDKTNQTRTISDRLALLHRHVQLFQDTWGSTKNFSILKKFFKVYIACFPDADELRKRLMNCQAYNDVYSVLDSLPKF